VKKCTECGDVAEVSVSWLTSIGPTRVRMCGACAARFWSKWGGTPTGDTVTITDDTALPLLAQGAIVEDQG
jgi:hypothetical protein